MLLELVCPICDADIALDGDERPGDEVYCTYCGSACTVRRGGQEDEQSLEVDAEF